MFANFKYRIWNKPKKEYVSEEVLVNQDGKIINTSHPYRIYQDDYVVEPCTNFTDINNVLIYENDIVEFYLDPLKSRKITGKIRYDLFGFFIYEKLGGVLCFTKRDYTVIGNANFAA